MLKRPTNRSRAIVQQLAAAAIEANGGATLARVFYKFDCAQCGSREWCPDPNVLPNEGVCTVCGATSAIKGAGYALHTRRGHDVPWEAGNPLVLRPRYESDKGDA